MVATMIKFVCATCAERLSVSEQFAGRKGACPSCGSINRVPLRGFVETQGSTATRAVTPSQANPRITVPAQMATAAADVGHRTSVANGVSSPSRTHVNGSTHNGHDVAAASAVKTPFVDRRGRLEPAVQPTLPPVRRTTLPTGTPVHVEIPMPPPSIVQPAAKAMSIAPPAPKPFATPSLSTPTATPSATLPHATGGSFLDVAVAAMPEHQPEDQVNIYAQRHALAADQLTPGQRWRQAFAAEDAQPSRMGRLLSWTGRGKTSGGATESTLSTSLEDESLPTAVKAGLLVGGVLCLAGAIYGVLHLMLWMSAGVR